MENASQRSSANLLYHLYRLLFHRTQRGESFLVRADPNLHHRIPTRAEKRKATDKNKQCNKTEKIILCALVLDSALSGDFSRKIPIFSFAFGFCRYYAAISIEISTFLRYFIWFSHSCCIYTDNIHRKPSWWRRRQQACFHRGSIQSNHTSLSLCFRWKGAEGKQWGLLANA